MVTAEQRSHWYAADGSPNHHVTHTHYSYRLTCEDFEALLLRAGRSCEVCRRSDQRLVIDHAGRLARPENVRGLLCHGCNLRMRSFDLGRRPPTPEVVAYYALGPPPTGRTSTAALVRAALDELIDVVGDRNIDREGLEAAAAQVVRRHELAKTLSIGRSTTGDTHEPTGDYRQENDRD